MATGEGDRLVIQFRIEQAVHGFFNLPKRHMFTTLEALDKIGQFDVFIRHQLLRAPLLIRARSRACAEAPSST